MSILERVKGAAHYFFDAHEVDFATDLKLHVDGPEIFSRIFSLIESAKQEISFEIYMFANDSVGRKVREALISAVKRGVSVRLIFDHLGSIPNEGSFFNPLIKAGGQVLGYHPVIPWRDRYNLARRDHRKLILSDGTLLMGGINIADDYERPISKNGFHDLAIEGSGHVVQVASTLFERTWKKELEHKRLEFERKSLGFGNAQVIGNNHLLDRWRLRRSLLYAMSQAEHTVEMINPYFLPAPDLLTLFRRLVKRGVKVTVIVPEASDIIAVNLATERIQQKFLRRNVEILRYSGRLHAKAILVDGAWASIGSYNFDYQSLFRNLEVVFNTVESSITSKLKEVIEIDRSKSRALTLDHWKNMPFLRKLAARILYRLRRFL